MKPCKGILFIVFALSLNSISLMAAEEDHVVSCVCTDTLGKKNEVNLLAQSGAEWANLTVGQDLLRLKCALPDGSSEAMPELTDVNCTHAGAAKPGNDLLRASVLKNKQ